MTRSKIFFIAATLVFQILFAPNVFAKSAVWKVSKGDDYFYLGGTFHILSADDHPLPEEFVQAYADASEVIFESDIKAASSPSFVQKMMTSMMFSDGRTLASELKPETYARLKAFMDARQLPAESFAQFQPWGVSMILVMQEYASLGMTPEYGVETYFDQLATRDDKTIQSLETVDQQLEFLSSLGDIDPDLNIDYTLRDLGKAAGYIQELKTGWRTGDLAAIEKNVSVVQMKEEFPVIYETLLATRNDNWMKQLVTLFDDDAIEIVLVGALHLAGEEGLINQLQMAGFEVEQLD